MIGWRPAINASGRQQNRPDAQPIIGSAWWAPNGFAAIPTAALDPPHSAASPAVPALMGPGPHFYS